MTLEPLAGEAAETQAAPLNIGGAFHHGRLYYPYRLKRVVIEDGVELTRYETLVLRSDGVSLGFGYKAAPRGTPSEDRVLALDDGTELSRPPQAAPGQSFSLAGIARFVAARERGQSALGASPAELLSQLEGHLKRAATLPFEEDYSLLALCVLASYCQRVFRAVPGFGFTTMTSDRCRKSCDFESFKQSQPKSGKWSRFLSETRPLG